MLFPVWLSHVSRACTALSKHGVSVEPPFWPDFWDRGRACARGGGLLGPYSQGHGSHESPEIPVCRLIGGPNSEALLIVVQGALKISCMYPPLTSSCPRLHTSFIDKSVPNTALFADQSGIVRSDSIPVLPEWDKNIAFSFSASS